MWRDAMRTAYSVFLIVAAILLTVCTSSGQAAENCLYVVSYNGDMYKLQLCDEPPAMSSKRLTNPASTSLEQSISPAAGGPLTYDAHNIGEFDAARKEADDYWHKENDLKRAAYVSRTFEKASFECVLK
jgi:hypothetical protein